MYLITLCQSPFFIISHILLLHSMTEQVTDMSKFLSEMNEKFSSMEQTISEQGADINCLYRIIDQKDKEIHVLKETFIQI